MVKFGTDVSVTAIGNSSVLDFHQLPLHLMLTFVSHFFKTAALHLAALLKEGKGLEEAVPWLEA